MEDEKPIILVLGATGQVGKGVLPHLSVHADVRVIAAARSPEKASHLGVPVRHLDLDRHETIAPALQGVERVFLVTGYTVDMLRQSKGFLDVARKVGVKHIVHLGACGDNETRVGAGGRRGGRAGALALEMMHLCDDPGGGEAADYWRTASRAGSWSKRT